MDRNQAREVSALRGFLIFAAFMVLVGLAMHGAATIGSAEKHREVIDNKNIRINHLELKVERLENCCRWSSVLEQMLPPLAKAELDVMVEQLKQKKVRKHE